MSRSASEIYHKPATLVELLRWRADTQGDQLAYTFLVDGEREGARVTFGDLDRRARAIASWLRSIDAASERALLLYPPGLEFLAAFFGCLYAGVIGVPSPPLDNTRLKRTLPRLRAILSDAGASIALSTSEILSASKTSRADTPDLQHLRWLATDELSDDLAGRWEAPALRPDTLAYLQYTSGSTSTPRGVMISHRNVMHHCGRLTQALGYTADSVAVTWLPYFHDYGLVEGILQPLYAGIPCFVMSPLSFVKQPSRWLRAISRYRATHSEAFNFAYESCVQKTTPEQREGLDLRSWRMAGNGAEPIRAETLERFVETFGPCGFRRDAFYPSYGLAEATLIVSTGPRRLTPPWYALQASALQQNRIVLGSGDKRDTRVVGCGRPICDKVLIVDGEARVRCPPDGVGEIWVSDPGVAEGYWRRPEDTESTFRACLADTGEGPFLRTGDLGFIKDGELYITGRAKDVIILQGANHYPQDIEWTVERSHEAVKPNCSAAFAIDVGGEERLVVIAEVRDPSRVEGVVDAIRQAIVEHHEIPVHAISLLRARAIPKTSSGKIQRSACSSDFLAGRLDAILAWVSGEPRPTPGGERAPARIASRTAGAIQEWLLAEMARQLGVERREIHVREPFARYGLGSHQAVSLVGDLERWLGVELPPTLLWAHPTIEAVARHLAGEAERAGAAPFPAAGASVSRDGGAPEPIAVIGLGCRFPGGADDPDAFWRLLRDGVDAITEVPADRWDVDALYAPDPVAPGKMSTRWGGFVGDVRGFDAAFFGISPREAASADPQQRLLLETAWEALEDAGQPRERLAGAAVGVFVGISTQDYGRLQAGALERCDIHAATGNALSIAANRISYLLNLRGPSVSVDTACSSSLVAVHLACQSLWRGEATLALAGGVNLILSPEVTIQFSKAGFMAPDGRCKAFDARANGYVRSEGAGVAVLKPLSHALADGDRIYAVLRGSAVNQDGRSNGLTAPNQGAQEELLRAAYRHAGVSPGEIRYVEAHGTGTALGDPIEARALGAVLAEGRSAGRPAALGSVKANIGHLEAAAGIAGLIKVALSIHHGAIPQSLHFEQPNRNIPFDELPLRVQKTAGPWSGRALAGVSSFGFGGTNAHVVVEEAPRSAAARLAEQPEASGREQLLLISARSEGALRALACAYAERLGCGGALRGVSLEQVCAAAALRRSHHDQRLAAVGSSPEELAEALLAFVQGERRRGLSYGHEPSGRRRRVVFVFPGQGWQWAGMGRQLAGEAAFSEALRACEQAFAPYVDWSLRAVLAGEQAALLERIEVLQPVLFAMQLGLASQLRSWGVEPDAVVGHSLGEVAAAAVCGALSVEQAARVICVRSRLLARLSGRGAMAMVELTAEQAELALRGRGGRVSVAACNGPRSTVLSGERQPLGELVGELEAQGVFCRPIRVDVASHCAQVDPLCPELEGLLQGLKPARSAVAMVSTVTGQRLEGGELAEAYWARNVRQPVLFEQAIKRLLDDGPCAFVEVSGHPILLPAITQTVQQVGQQAVTLGSLRREEPERASLLGAVGALYTSGQPMDLQSLYPGPAAHVPLPSYPWQREPYWFQARGGGVGPAAAGPAAGSHPLLGEHLSSSAHAGTDFWQTRLSTQACPWLADHRVDGRPVLPASAYVEMALAAGRALGAEQVLLQDVVFRSALFLSDQAAHCVQSVVCRNAPDAFSFRVSSLPAAAERGASWTWNAAGTLRLGAAASAVGGAEPLAIEGILARCRESASGAEHYEAMEARGMSYGPSFQGVRRVWHRDGEALAEVRLPEPLAAEANAYAIHPALLDACFQAVVAALPAGDGRLGPRDALLPTGIKSLLVYPGAWSDGLWSHAALRPTEGADEGAVVADVVVMNTEGQVLAAVHELRARAWHREDERIDNPLRGWFHRLEWRPYVLPAAGPAPLTPGAWLLLADRGGVAETLRGLLEARGETCHVVRPGEGYHVRGPRLFEIDAARPELWRQLLGDALRAGPPCRGIVHLWSLDSAPPESSSPPSLEVAQRLGIDSVLCLIQGLAQTDWKTAPRLWLVTSGAQAVGLQVEAVSIAQSPLWGLGRAIAYEHPELRCACVDLDPAGGPDEARALRALEDELWSDSPEAQVALRGGSRYVARLARCADLPPGVARSPGRDERAAEGHKDDVAWRLEIAAPGLLDTLALRPVPRRRPARGQVEIRVHAAGLNFLDVLSAMGARPDDSGGVIELGAECAGTVTAVGEGVSELRVGDEVIAIAQASFSTFAIADAALVVSKPAGVSFEQGATIPIAFMTAHYGLHHLGRLSRGDRVLIHAAAGGVGLAAVQIAAHAGAEIFATAGTPEKQEHLRALGVPHVMHSRSLAFAGEVLERTGGRGVDVVLNSLTGPAIAASLEALASYGRFVEIGKRDIYDNAQLGLGPFRKNLSYMALDLARMLKERPDVCSRLLREVVAQVERGALRPLEHRTFAATAAIDAFRHMAQAKHIGKIVFSLEPPGVAAAAADERGAAVRADGTYLITGGLGGLGLSAAQWLVDQGARHLVLVSRGGSSDEARVAISGLEQAGARVVTASADVARKDALGQVLATIDEAMPPLRGVIHAAGVLDDGLLLQQTPERFSAVMRPKVLGAWNLHALTSKHPIDLFVLFSSAASLLGSPGQGSYCAANAFLGALSHDRRARGLPALCIAWGPWAGVGLAAAEANRGARLAARGLGGITPEQGKEALGRVLCQGAVEVAVMPFHLRHWREFYPAVARSPLFAELGEELGSGASKASQRAMRAALLARAPAERRALLEAHVREQVAHVLRMDPARLDRRASLMGLGLDSLMGLEIRNRLEASLDLTLPATLMFIRTSLEDLASYLASRMGIDLEGPKPTIPEPRRAEAGLAAAELEPLSAEEMAALLSAKLSTITQGSH